MSMQGTADADHTCPRCGRITSGAWSEGGARWALCEECLEENVRKGVEEAGDRKSLDSDAE